MSIDRRSLLVGALAAGLAGMASAQTPPPVVRAGRSLVHPDPEETIDLWDPPPELSVPPLVEEVRERSTDPDYNDRIVLGISVPRMAVFRPARPNGAAVLIMPGGGYGWVVVDKEGYEMARLLAAHGITVFVLFYRLPREGWMMAGPNVALSDAQRAIRMIRHRAGEFGLDRAKVCAMGFSAGGHVCADLLTRFATEVYPPEDEIDPLSARPDAAALLYPVISMSAPHAHPGSRRNLLGESPSPALERAHSPHLNVPADAPPCFLLHAEDDASVPAANSRLMHEALRARRIPVEMHLFPDGGHGFGLRLARGKSVERWPDLFLAWGRSRGLWS